MLYLLYDICNRQPTDQRSCNSMYLMLDPTSLKPELHLTPQAALKTLAHSFLIINSSVNVCSYSYIYECFSCKSSLGKSLPNITSVLDR